MNPSILEKNKQVIQQNTNHEIVSIDLDENKYDLGFEEGFLSIKSKGTSLKYNNLIVNEEVDKLNYSKNGLYFILGLSDVKSIVTIFNNATKGSAILCIEPNPEMFHFIISNYDLTELFSRKNFYLLVTDYESIPEYFGGFLTKKSLITKTSNLQFYTSHYLEYYEKLKVLQLQKSFIDIIKTELFSLGNSTRDTLQGLLQNLLNLKTFCKTMSVNKIKNQYSSLPVVIVSAGPSLEKNINHLKEIPRENILIFAVDTSLVKLLDIGITPDAVFSIERVVQVYDYFYKDIKIPKDTVFVGPLVVYPKIIEQFTEDRMIIPLRENDAVNTWLNTLVLGESEQISMGASVAHLAFSFARYIGCNPIIFIGQDLAYGTDGLTHSKGTVYDKDKIPHRKQEEFFVDGYFEQDVKTTRTWKHFTNWFEKEFYNTEQLIINATEGGAKIRHSEQMTLRNALRKYASKPITPIYQFVDKNYEPVFDDHKGIEKRIVDESEKLKEFSIKMEQFLIIIKDMEIELDDTNKTKLYEAVNKIIEMDNVYKQDVTNLAFLNFFVQTHILIASFEFNKLNPEISESYLQGLVKIFSNLFETSKKLSDLISNELVKFLNTSWNEKDSE
ncbi:hypothetical protein GCM10011351_21870 [Paraliobacillus quinghaiensis]|uniref:6-hydroxymethylpterin diphosphokinase MptE-like domain-containing protein n=1 Tax=Paraliobacillus quinghaiensis TaxID=470815 RepID=A0A917TST6_9BACI|nr:6-hydroxymethylpterin diphosphokinase MptE-like protein [Paraliobacillus quinghaiensis]GGM35413.1 hypothetical protein GCM10011351_21870 [Paraliobacillus quinghaiensis]